MSGSAHEKASQQYTMYIQSSHDAMQAFQCLPTQEKVNADQDFYGLLHCHCTAFFIMVRMFDLQFSTRTAGFSYSCSHSISFAQPGALWCI